MAQSSNTGSFMDSVKEFFTNFDIKRLSEKIGGTSAEAIHAALYFGLFFAIGFLSKKYFKFVIILLIGSALFIKCMEYNSLLTINWAAIKTWTGITKISDINMLINAAFGWVKQHVLLTIASTVGFLVGYKLG